MDAKRRILSASVRLLWEKGYTNTTVADIMRQADVSCVTFQNIFHTKDGLLAELAATMFTGQFAAAGKLTGGHLPPVYEYAVETSIQLALTEMNENLRDIYLAAYTHEKAMDFIHRQTARQLVRIFALNLPGYTESDFYELELGSAGLMRGYMAHACTADFPLERKLEKFLTLALRGYKVPEEEVQQVLAFLGGLDIRGIAQKVMEELFRQLAMRYEFSPDGLLPPEK